MLEIPFPLLTVVVKKGVSKLHFPDLDNDVLILRKS
jgi:hypothetical protein